MANIKLTKFYANESNLIVARYDIIGDGSGDYDEAVLFDIATANNDSVLKRITKIEYELNGFSAALLWDASTNRQTVTIEDSHHEKVCWEWFGGDSNCELAGATGSIRISTTGLGDGDRGYIILNIVNLEKKPGTV